MREMINKLNYLINSPLVTPYNLLENCRLTNYNYVKYYTVNTAVVCEMEISGIEDSGKYYYYFDTDNHLQRIEKDSNNNREILFDRNIEIEKEKIAFSSYNKKNEVAL